MHSVLHEQAHRNAELIFGTVHAASSHILGSGGHVHHRNRSGARVQSHLRRRRFLVREQEGVGGIRWSSIELRSWNSVSHRMWTFGIHAHYWIRVSGHLWTVVRLLLQTVSVRQENHQDSGWIVHVRVSQHHLPEPTDVRRPCCCVLEIRHVLVP